MVLKRRAVSLFASFVLSLFVLATPLMGQAPNDQASSVVRLPAWPEWGGSDRVLYAVGAGEFTPLDNDTPYGTLVGQMGRYSQIPLGDFEATPHLPSGVLLTYLELDYCDTVSPPVLLQLYECSFLGDDCLLLAGLSSNNGATGCAFVAMDLTPLNYTTDNNTKRLALFATTSSGTFENAITGAYIGYKLQVSPAPASATFLDVPTGHPYFRFIEALVDAGITAGCGGNNYCVNNPITRGEMAVFLSVALGLHFSN